jgi:hypothetical protein
MEKTQEEWRWIIDRYGQQSMYQVSSLGRVRTQHTGRAGKILSGGEGPDSQSPKRRKVWLKDVLHPQSRPHSVEKLVAVMFHGRPKPGQKVIWLNGHQWDNRADNIRWGSAHEEVVQPVNGEGFTIEQLQAHVMRAREDVLKAHRELAKAEVALIHGKAQIVAQEGVQGD